ncbi:MAG TPA: hypothetical protein VKG01_05515 [Thermoanaerobaculia bacterium]|nr:hypothetical protein [Thermoanaerobaculia bacterium]
MYEALAAAAFSPEDPEQVVEAVGRLRRRNPDLSRDELACRLAGRTALLCGAIAALGEHVAFQALALDRMLLSIARVSGRPASPLERAGAAAASVLAAGMAEGLRRGALRTSRLLPARRASLLPPVASVLAAGAVTYGAAQLLGLAARRYFFGRGRPRT